MKTLMIESGVQMVDVGRIALRGHPPVLSGECRVSGKTAAERFERFLAAGFSGHVVGDAFRASACLSSGQASLNSRAAAIDNGALRRALSRVWNSGRDAAATLKRLWRSDLVISFDRETGRNRVFWRVTR